MDKEVDECYNCAYFKYYNFFTENVHCSKHGVYQFGFGERLYCHDHVRKNKIQHG